MTESSQRRAGPPFSLTVVVPCLDEAENIEAVYDEIASEMALYDLEILFVDDGSTDATLERIRDIAARDAAVSYLSLARNFGLEAAFSAGFCYARNEWVLQLDADLQFPPAEGHRLIERAREGFDAVFGVRVDRQDGWRRRTASAVHDLIARRLLGIEIPRGASSFRLVRTDLARRVVELQLGTPYFLATVPRLTRHWTTEPVRHRPRRAGEAKVTLRGLARHALELFVSFSGRPMLAAMLCLLLGACLGGAAFVVGLTSGSLATAVAIVSLGETFGLAALAIMARYLVHLGRGQPGTPQFQVREANVTVRLEHALLVREQRVATSVPGAG